MIRNLEGVTLQGFGAVLGWSGHPNGFAMLCMLGLWVSIGVNMWRPNVPGKIAAAFFFLVLQGASNSFGKINHQHHLVAYATLAMIFFSAQENRKASNLKVLHFVQLITLAIYFTAGIWKVNRSVPDFFSSSSTSDVLNHFAYMKAIGLGTTRWVEDNLETLRPFFDFGFIAMVLFELTAIIPFFKPKLARWWAAGGIIFHLANGLLLNVFFTPHSGILILFFFIFPSLLTRPPSAVAEFAE